MLADPDVEAELIRRHTGLAVHHAQRVALTRDVDDAIQDGLFGLIRAHRRYRPDGGADYTQWVTSGLERAILDGHRNRSGWRRRQQTNRLKPLSLDARLADTDLDSGPLTLADTIAATGPDPDNAAVAADLADYLRTIITNDVDAFILDGLLAGRRQDDMAIELGVTPGRIAQRVHRIRAVIAAAL